MRMKWIVVLMMILNIFYVVLPVGGETVQKLDVLDLKQVDILDVLKLISQKLDLNIVSTKQVSGKVSVQLKDVEVWAALSIILDSYHLAYKKDGDILRVMSAQEYFERYGVKFDRKIESLVIVIKNDDAKSIAQIVDQLKGPLGKIIVNQKNNSLLLMDEAHRLEEMVAVITQLDQGLETEVIDINYADVQVLSKQVEELLTPDFGMVKVDERSNRLMIRDTARKIRQAKELIEAFDQKHREVLIEAKIVQVTLSDEHKMGIDWEVLVSGYHDLGLSGNFDVLGATEKRGKMNIGTLASDDYSVLIEALEMVGDTNILSNPRILVLNNHEAKMLVGLTEPYVSTTTTTPATGPATTAESVNFIEVGVKLYVTPTINQDDFVTLKIKPEVSSVVDNLTTSNNNTIPIVETSEAETTVMVKNNVTIMIGGLIKDENISSSKKVPLFGSIPFLGRAFQNSSELIRKTEIVIFLTPRIITGDVEQSLDDYLY